MTGHEWMQLAKDMIRLAEGCPDERRKELLIEAAMTYQEAGVRALRADRAAPVRRFRYLDGGGKVARRIDQVVD